MNGMFRDPTKLVPAIIRGTLVALGLLLLACGVLALLNVSNRDVTMLAILVSLLGGVIAGALRTIPRKEKPRTPEQSGAE